MDNNLMTIIALGVLSATLFIIVVFCEVKLAIRSRAYDKTMRTLLGDGKMKEKEKKEKENNIK